MAQQQRRQNMKKGLKNGMASRVLSVQLTVNYVTLANL